MDLTPRCLSQSLFLLPNRKSGEWYVRVWTRTCRHFFRICFGLFVFAETPIHSAIHRRSLTGHGLTTPRRIPFIEKRVQRSSSTAAAILTAGHGVVGP